MAHMLAAITAEHAKEGRKEIQKTVLFAEVGIGRKRGWLQNNVRLFDVASQL